MIFSREDYWYFWGTLTWANLQVVWFWNIVGSYSEEMRARLLQFVTGSSRVPLQGFKALQVLDFLDQKSADFLDNDITIHLLQGSTGAAGPRLFTLHLVDVDPGNLPKAHTCFNRCSLPISRVFMVLIFPGLIFHPIQVKRRWWKSWLRLSRKLAVLLWSEDSWYMVLWNNLWISLNYWMAGMSLYDFFWSL